jgi:hypothetical protein
MDGQAANGPIPKLFSPIVHAKMGAASIPLPGRAVNKNSVSHQPGIANKWRAIADGCHCKSLPLQKP